MKKVIALILCVVFSVMLFGCYSASDVEIYFSEIAVYGGYMGELLAEFNVDEVYRTIEEEDHIKEGEETRILSVLESKAVNKKIQSRLAEETSSDYTAEIQSTKRVYLDNGDVAVLYIYDVRYTVDEEDKDTAAFDEIGRLIVVMVKE